MNLYSIAHILRDRFGWLWDFIELVNSWLFSLRFGRRLKGFSFSSVPEGYEIKPLCEVTTEKMVEFFKQQPEEAYTFFHPHGFDAASIKRLQSNRAFLAYVLLENNHIVGYLFLRSFFTGKCFRGKMVDYQNRGRGLAKLLGMIANEIAYNIGLRMFATVSPENIASFASTKAVNEIKIIKQMPNGDYLIEELPKND